MRYGRTIENNVALAIGDQAENGPQGRRFAGAVAADQRHGFAGTDVKRDVVKNMRATIGGIEAVDGELWLRRCSMRSSKQRPGAEIDGLHLRIGAHHPRRTFGNENAAIEHEDPIGMAEDRVHVVLGEEHADRTLASDPRDE